MSETTKRQQVILLHGTEAFTLDKATAKGLAQGELVIEHGDNGAKLHTLDKNNELATFINETAIDGKIGTVQEAVEANAENIETLQGVVGDANGGLVQDVTAHAAAIQELKESMGLVTPGEGGVDNSLSARIVKLETAVGDTNNGLVKTVADNHKAFETHVDTYTTKMTVVDGHIAAVNAMLTGYGGAKTVASDVAAAKTEVQAVSTNKYVSVTTSNGADNHTIYTIDVTGFADGEAFDEVAEKVSTLFGDDATTKSVRTIANEELARMLIDEADNGAEDNFKTLTDLANWLEQHPEDVATMNSERAALEAALGDFVSRTDGVLVEGTQTVSAKFKDVDEDVEDLGERLTAVETDYINAITTNAASGVTVEAVEGNAHTWNFDFSGIVINGGTY